MDLGSTSPSCRPSPPPEAKAILNAIPRRVVHPPYPPPPAPHATGEPQDLPTPHLEANTGEDATPTQSLHTQRGLADRDGLLGEEGVERSANHQRDQLVAGNLAGAAGGYMLAIAQHGDTI